MRLIDADWLLGELSNSWEKLRKKEIKHISITNLINNAPTAYDIDEVVEQLDWLKDTEQDDSVAEFISTRIWNKAISKAIEIVKGGAK